MYHSLWRGTAVMAAIALTTGAHAALVVHYDMEETAGATVFDGVGAPASDGTIGGISFPIQDTPDTSVMASSLSIRVRMVAQMAERFVSGPQPVRNGKPPGILLRRCG
jgi:hypothetical protein